MMRKLYQASACAFALAAAQEQLFKVQQSLELNLDRLEQKSSLELEKDRKSNTVANFLGMSPSSM